jgi:hypothetical protein
VADDLTPEQVPFLDLGISGVARYGGVSRVYEEFLKELQGPSGMKLYREQASNCPVTGAILFAAQHLARGVTARVDPANRRGADPRDALRVADRVSGALFDDLDTTWPDTVSEIFSMLTFGWALMEVTWKRCQGSEPPRTQSMGESLMPPPRSDMSGETGQGPLPGSFTPSKFDDGWVTWKSWGLRAQETLFMWEWDANSRAKVMQQMAPPDYKVRRIPLTKCLHFRTQVAKQNPEGVSLLRHSVPSYLMKKNVQWVEGVGVERDLAGYPVFQIKEPDPVKRWVPPDIWNPNDANAVRLLAQLKTMARSVKRDDQEGMVLPWWIDFSLKSAGGTRRQFDTNKIVERYEQRILMSLLADFIMLGHDAVGSKALASTKSQLFTTALTSILEIIAAVINRFAIPELLRFNGVPQELCPTLVFGDVENIPLEALGGYVANLAKAGMPLFPDGDLENFLRDAAKMPNTDPAGTIGDASAVEEPVTEPTPAAEPVEPVVRPVPTQPLAEERMNKRWFDLAAAYLNRPAPAPSPPVHVPILASAPVIHVHSDTEAVMRLTDALALLTVEVGKLKAGADIERARVPPTINVPAPIVDVRPVINVPATVVNVSVPEPKPAPVMKRVQIVHRDKDSLITHVETVERPVKK